MTILLKPASTLIVALLSLLASQQNLASPTTARQADPDSSGRYSDSWRVVSSFNISDTLPIVKYQSKRTGLRVLIAHAESPIVNGYFCVTTEAHTEDGLPHTLEHLIFLGSEDYPYKEMLDLTANRCLADRTNAWTSTDHTCYTVYTAGSGGFLNILPIYMDHILHPLLRDEDFLTEVHHISGQGKDAGVVYSEMQGVELKDSNLLYFATADELYPGPSSYEVRTGGRLKNLRESTTIEKVREYHKRYYQPRNVYITITGNIDAEELFKALDPVEEKILSQNDSYPEYERPFTTEYPPLPNDIDRTIKFPSSDETFGRITIGRRLPYKLRGNVEKLHALSFLGSYLTSTTVSPLKEAFVNIPEPYCTDIDFDIHDFSDPAYSLEFKNVPVEKMEEIEPLLNKTITQIIEDGPEKFDLDRMHILVKRTALGMSMNLENSPHLVVPSPAVQDMVYGRTEADLMAFLAKGQEAETNKFLAAKADFWLDLLKETFSGPRSKVLAYPSKEYDEQLQKEENERIAEQIEKLGPEGLQEAAEAVANAVESQTLPPSDVLRSIPVADVNKIVFRRLEYYNYTTEQPENFDLRSIPFKFHLDDLDSQFIRYFLFFDMSKVSQEDRPWLVLLAETWLQTPVEVDGKVYELSDVIKRRSNDVLTFYNDIGYKGSTFTPGSQSELMMFYTESLMDKYEIGIDVVKEALFQVKFTEERTRAILSMLLNSIPRAKNSGASILKVISDNIYFNEECNIHHMSFLRQEKFLKKAQEMLNKDPAQVLDKLKSLSQQIVQPSNTFVYLATNVKQFVEKHGDKAAGMWINFFPKEMNYVPEETLSKRFSTPSENQFSDPNPEIRHAIAGIPGSESCYLRQGIPFNMTDWEDDDVAAVRVMLEYLSAQMYNKIRGQGLVYSASLSSSVTEGRMIVGFSRSSQFEDAYTVFREIISNYSSGAQDVWDDVLLDSARGSIIYDWASREETVENLASVSVKSILRGTSDPFYNRRFVHKVAKVTMKDVQRVAATYLPMFMDPSVTHTAITCGPRVVNGIQDKFSEWGFDLLRIEDLDDSFISN